MTDIAVDFAECSAMAGRVAHMVYGDDTPEGAGGAPREGGDKRSPGKQSASQEERCCTVRAYSGSSNILMISLRNRLSLLPADVLLMCG